MLIATLLAAATLVTQNPPPAPVPLIPLERSLAAHGVRGETLAEALAEAGLSTAMMPALRVLEVELEQPLSDQHFLPADSDTTSMLTLRTAAGHVLRAHRPTGRLTTFRDETRLARREGSRPQITQQQAQEKANTFLAALGMEARFLKEHALDPAYEGGAWRFHMPVAYQGVACGGGIRVWVAGVDGRILLYSDGPPCVPPQSMARKIEKKKAESLAESFLKKRYGRGLSTGRAALEIAIVHPNNAWSGGQNVALKEEPGTRLCWQAHFPSLKLQGTPRPVTVFVDAGTGQIVGGVR